MKFIPTPLEGAYLIEPEANEDARGFFSRIICRKQFEEAGLASEFLQINDSYSRKKGTLRGLHYQVEPAAEVKLVRCIQGALFDVILDIRPNSTTYGKWYGTELSANNRKMLYVPKGFAHGFLTLEDDTEMLYFVTENYSPKLERGIRWNDPAFRIDWPAPPSVLSEKDSAHPDFASLRSAK